MGNSPPLDQRTINKNYPLPTGKNYLGDDVLRLQSALAAIDSDISAAATRLVAIRTVSASYLVQASDLDFMVDYTGGNAADTIQLPAVGSVLRGFSLYIRNSATVSITVTTTGGATINGTASFGLVPVGVVQVVCDGSTWKILSLTQSSSGTLALAGAVAAPSYSFSPDPTVGVYLPANGQGGLAASGANAMLWSNNGILVGSAAGGFKGQGSINAQAVLYNGQDLIARSDGSAASPTYSFGSEASLGFYRAASGIVGFSATGADQFYLSKNGLRAAAATQVSGTQPGGTANLVDLYIQGNSLSSQVSFSAAGVLLAGAAGGAKGSGTLNANDLFLSGNSLKGLLNPYGVAANNALSIYSVAVDRSTTTPFLAVVVANYKAAPLSIYLSVDGVNYGAGNTGGGYARSTATGQFFTLQMPTLPADGLHTISISNGSDGTTVTATVNLLSGNVFQLTGATSGSALNLAELYINGQSLTSSLAFGPSGLFLPGATGGFKGAGTLNVAALYINGTSISSTQLTPAGNALRYIRINSGANGYDYRTNAQVLSDIGAQPLLSYSPLNKAGDTIAYLTVSAALTVGGAATLNSTLNVAGAAGFAGISVSGAATLSAGLSVTGATTLATLAATSATFSGAATVGTTLTSNGAAILRTTLQVSGATTLQSSLNVSGAASFGAGSFSGQVTLSGVTFGSTLASSNSDLSKHITLWSPNYGFSVTSGRLNYNTGGGSHNFMVSGVDKFSIDSSGNTNVMGGLTVNGGSTIRGALVSTASLSGTQGAVDLRGITQGSGNAFWLGSDNFLALDDAGSRCFFYSSSTLQTVFATPNGSMLLIGDSGQFTASNRIQAGTYFAVSGTQVVGPRSTGWGTSTAGSKANYNHTTATLAQTNACVAAIYTALLGHGLIGSTN